MKFLLTFGVLGVISQAMKIDEFSSTNKLGDEMEDCFVKNCQDEIKKCQANTDCKGILDNCHTKAC